MHGDEPSPNNGYEPLPRNGSRQMPDDVAKLLTLIVDVRRDVEAGFCERSRLVALLDAAERIAGNRDNGADAAEKKKGREHAVENETVPVANRAQ
jgi:hypothetical protein